MTKTKVIIDTDIGDDADDALALCLALKSKELEVLGITTVFRNTAARARIAVSLLREMGREDIPVFAGAGHPLVEEADVGLIPKQLFPEMEGLAYNEEISALEYLRRELLQANEPITLVTIGPLTNIALLLQLYPEVKTHIKEIVMMAGAYYMHYNEWNVRCDPEAAHMVYTSGLSIRAVGLDVTTCCQVDDELVAYLAGSGKPGTRLLSELLLCYRKNRGRHTFLHDPMAVYAVYDKELIEFCGEDIMVELHGQHTRGMTFNRFKIGFGSECPRIQCAKKVDSVRFKEAFRRILTSD